MTPAIKTKRRQKVIIASVLAISTAWGAIVSLSPGPDEVVLPLAAVTDPAQRKAQFIAAMLPLITLENDRIERQRARAANAPEGSPHYNALAYGYGLKPGAPRAQLLSRIDIVPASLALAQGAIESGWGTSRFAQEGNAYFGERTYDADTPGITPRGALKDWPPFRVKSFPNAQVSIRSFMKTLNTHRTYAALRQRRAAMRTHNQRPTGLALAPFLLGYSEIGTSYMERVISTIRAGRMDAYDEPTHNNH